MVTLPYEHSAIWSLLVVKAANMLQPSATFVAATDPMAIFWARSLLYPSNLDVAAGLLLIVLCIWHGASPSTALVIAATARAEPQAQSARLPTTLWFTLRALAAGFGGIAVVHLLRRDYWYSTETKAPGAIAMSYAVSFLWSGALNLVRRRVPRGYDLATVRAGSSGVAASEVVSRFDRALWKLVVGFAVWDVVSWVIVRRVRSSLQTIEGGFGLDLLELIDPLDWMPPGDMALFLALVLVSRFASGPVLARQAVMLLACALQFWRFMVPYIRWCEADSREEGWISYQRFHGL